MTPSPPAASAPAVRPGPARHGRPLRPSRPAPRPRRVSGPVRPRAAGAGAASLPWPGRRSARAGARLPDRLLERLIGGRAWIAVIAFALIGIVAMQLWVMKLGAGIGRALDHTQLLARENSALEIENSALSSAARIERLALAKGMVPASPGALRFLTPRGPLDARLAAAALARPTQPSSSSSSTTSSEEAPATPGNEAAASPAEATGAAATGAQGPATEAPAGGG